MTIMGVLNYTEVKQTVLNYGTSKPWASTVGGKTGICPSQLEIGTKNQNFPETLTSAAQFRLIDLFIAMTVY